MSENKYKLSNGWIVFKVSSSKYVLHVMPIENNIFRTEYCVEIPQGIYDIVVDGIRDVKILGKTHDLYKHAMIWLKGTPKTSPKRTENKYYGTYWYVENLHPNYYLHFQDGAHGGGRRISITEEIYYEIRSEVHSPNEVEVIIKGLIVD